MSRTRRGEREQGHEEEEVYYAVVRQDTDIVMEANGSEELFPRLGGVAVAARTRGGAGLHYLVTDEDMREFLRAVGSQLQERRELQENDVAWEHAYEALRQEKRECQSQSMERLRKVVDALQKWRDEQRKVSEATAENERLSRVNTQLRQDISEAERGIVEAGQEANEARREANEARVEASSVQEKLKETETAYEEAKKHFIMAPDLVPCLRSLSTEVKALHEEVRASGAKTIDAVVRRPPDERRNGKTLRQMRRVLHDIGRFPRRQRRGRAAGAADDGGEATKRGRVCYSCRCKGHLAKNCPRARTDTVASAEPTGSDTQPSSDVAAELNAASAYSGLNILSFFRRNFTSGID